MPNNNNRINFQVGYNVDQASVNAVKKSLQDLQNIKFKDFNGPKQDLDDIKQKASQVEAALNKAFNVNLNSLNTQSFNAELQKAGLSIDKIYTSFSKAGAQGQVAFSRMASEVLTTNMQLKLTNSLVSQMGETMANTVKWGIASSVMNNFTNSVRQAFDYVKALDSSLNDIRIVTKQSSDLMANFAIQANNSAQALGRSTMDYTKAALTFYQQGLDEASVQARTESVLKAQNITGAGLEMADYLTAVWNGYKVANEEAELYVDKLAAVADSSASNMSLLAIAMSKVASSANLLGVPVDNLNAQIATIVATTRQAPESVGNALKTIYSRINDIATGADDAEISLGNYSAKMALVGISVLDANGRLRDTGDVIDEIGGKWETLSHEQQIYLARTMAGQRQYNNLLALFENWSKYSDLVNVSMEAQGATALKNAIYMESLSAKMEQLGAAGEKVKAALIDEEDLKGLVDFGTGAVKLFGSLIESIGGGKNAILSFGTIFAQVFSGTITKEINNAITNFQNFRNNKTLKLADIENTKLYGASKGYKDDTISAMVNAKKAAQDYYDFMLPAQINEYNQYVKNIGQIKLKILVLLELKNKYLSLLKIIQRRKGLSLLDASLYMDSITDTIERQQSVIKTTQKTLVDYSGSIKKLFGRNLVDSITSSMTKVQASMTALGFQKWGGKDLLNKAELIKTLGLSSNYSITKIKALASEYQNWLNTARQNVKIGLNINLINTELQQLQNQMKMASQEADRFLNGVRQYASIQTFVNIAVGASQAITGISNLINLTKVWQDDTISAGEKIKQTFTNIGMSLPLVISGISSVIKNFKGFTSAIQLATLSRQIDVTALKEQIIQLQILAGVSYEQAAATATKTIALKAHAITLHDVALAYKDVILSAMPYVALAAGIAVAIYALYKEWNRLADAAKKAALVAQKTKETYDDLKSTYEELKSSLEDYNSAQEAIAEMTKGTQEWRDAIRESNDAVLDLIQSYPELASEVLNVNGQLIISAQAQQEALLKAAAAVDNARLASIVTADSSRNASLRASARESGRFAGLISYSGQFIQATTDQIMRVVKAYSTATDRSVLALSEQTGMSEQLISSILTEVENMDLLASLLQANTEATKLSYEAMASERLQGNKVYEGLDNLGKQITLTIAGKDLQLQTNIDRFILEDLDFRRVGSISQSSDEWMINILDRFRKAMGDMTIDWQSNEVTGFGGKLFHFLIDGQLVEYTKEQVAATIAAALALQNLLVSAQKASLMLTSMLLTGQANALKTFTAGNGFEDFTQGELRNINPKTHEMAVYFNTYAELAGYKDGKAYQNAFIEAVLSDIAKFDKLGNKYLGEVSLAYKDFKNKDISLGVALNIAKNLNQAFIHGGQLGLDNLKNIFKNLSSLDLLKLFSSINLIDWTQGGAASLLKEIIEEQGITIDSTNESWLTFISLLLKVSSKSIDAATNLDNLRGIVSSLKDIDTGDVLKDLDYLELIKLAPELRDSFKIADEGYMFIGTQQLIADALKTTTQLTISQLQLMDKVATLIAQKNFSEQIGKIDFGEADNYHLNSESIQALHNISLSLALSNALAIMGVSLEAFQNALAYIEKYGSVKRLLPQQMKDAYNLARAVVEDALNQIIEIQAQGEEGAYQVALRQTQELNATRAQSLEELRNLYYEEQILLEDYGDMRETLINKELDRLDITRLLYDATYDLLREHLELTSESFNELSLAEQQILLDQLTSRVYDLGDALDLLQKISSDTLDNIQLLINDNAVTTPEFYEQIGLLQAALLGIFQTDIDPSFIALNFDLIRQLALGDITALDELSIALAQDYTAQIKAEADMPSVGVAVDQFNAFLDTVDLQDLLTGITLDDAGFTDALQTFANLANLTADDINLILASIGFEPLVTEQSLPFNEENASRHGNTYTYTYTLPAELGGGTNVITMTSDDYDAAASSGVIRVPIINGKKIKYSGGSRTGSYARPSYTPKTSGRGGGGGGGSKAKNPTTVKPQKLSEAKDSIQDRSDVYHDINLELDKQEDILKDILEELKNLVDKDRLENLKKQNKLLEKQSDLLDLKSAIATGELVRLRNELISDLGNSISFDSNGLIANYNKALDDARDNYNDAIAHYNEQVRAAEEAYNRYVDQYNSMSAETQEANKAELERQKDTMDLIKKSAQKSLDIEKDKYDAIKDNIKEYDDTLKLQRDIANQQQEIQEKILENQIAASKIEVDLSIDTGDFERDWLEFENKFIKKLDKDDFLGSAKASAKELMSYFNSDQVRQTANEITKIRNEIAIMQAGGASSIYSVVDEEGNIVTQNLAQAQEDLEDYMKQQMDDLGDVQDLIDDIKDNYLDALDDAKDKMDDQIDQYERVNDLIDHNVKLTLLMYGDTAYNTMEKYYELQKANNKDLLDSLKLQQQYWQDLMKNLVEHSPAWEEMKKNLDDITDELNKKLEDMIENLSDQWLNRVDGIIARLNNGLTGGRGLDFLDEQWDYINNFDDNFLDTFESKMGIQEVTDLYQLAIDGLSGSPANQLKINKLMNEQLKILREKDNLTQYDIDRAKAALEVLKARMALEDAKYNKTKMRLRRDSQGNYTYQYVADEEKLGDLQAALADAQANLYNMDKEHYTLNLNNLYDAYKDYIDKMRELTEEYNSTQDEEERARIQSRIDLLRESTNKLMQGLTEDNRYALQYLNESFFGGMGIDTNLLSAELQMELMINNVPQMQSNIQDLANTLVGEGGILNATNDAMREISDATVEYDNNVKLFLEDAGSSLEIVTNVTDAAGNALDQNVANAKELITANDQLIESCEAQITAIQELMSWLDQYMSKVMNVLTLVANLRSAYGTEQQLNGSNLTADSINVESMGLDVATGADFTGNPVTDAAAVKQEIDKLMAQYELFLKQMTIATFDTGGSTGSWGDASGRLAFLHEKELVLNQQDTANILAAVNAVRMITGSLNGLATGEIGSLINNATGLLGGIDTNSTLDQNVHIEANFPNVTQHTEIEQAFNNLVNMASMKASGYRD